MTADTIAALATARGTAALAILRVSGPEAIHIIERHFRPAGKIGALPSHHCAVGTFMDGDEAVDRVVVALFRAPDSYTGEDLVEITSHGGEWVPARILKVLHAAGARSARPGEFTQRAYLNGKLDLTQAEAVEALILAKSGAAARAAFRILAGGLRRALEESLERLTLVLAMREANLDIMEDGAPDTISQLAGEPAELAGESRRTRDILGLEVQRLERLLEGGRAGKLAEEGRRVVLSGRPNAGKSSILNALLARERAIVSPRPGTTRDSLEAWVEWGGQPLVLVDTAGLSGGASADGGARDPLAEEAARRTRAEVTSAAIVVHVVDVQATRPDEVLADLESMPVPGGQVLIDLHKWDLGPCSEWHEWLSGADGGPTEDLARAGRERGGVVIRTPHSAAWRVVTSSVVDAPGTEPLRREILECLASAGTDAEAALLVGDRQREHVERALAALQRAIRLHDGGMGDELIAFEVRLALDCLGEVLGRRVGPLVLDQIFSRFCVGK
jgi:tRNA modification GTPase